MSSLRNNHRQVKLVSGSVLIVGGSTEYDPGNIPDLYHPQTRTFTPAAAELTMYEHPLCMHFHYIILQLYSQDFDMILLPNGTAMVAGGDDSSAVLLYDPSSSSFITGENMIQSRAFFTLSLLPHSGSVLAAGNDDS